MNTPQPFGEQRAPGRSFTDPSRPLGDEILERSSPEDLPNRAKCVAVLRKADELMFENNPSGATAEGQRRALELACGRCGVLIDKEYEHWVAHDEELKSLQALVMENARARAV